MKNLRSRLRSIENKKHLDGSDKRELKQVGEEIKEFLDFNNTPHDEFDFNNWTGACAAFGKVIEVNTNNHYIKKDGTKIPASEILKKQEQQNNNI